MMKRMFGFCCYSVAGALAVITEAVSASRQAFLVMLMDLSLVLGCQKWAGGGRPMVDGPHTQRDGIVF
jgi:hypothetical protein